MTNRITYILFGLILSTTVAVVANEGFNPFAPLGSSSGAGAQNAFDMQSNQSTHPLQMLPVKNYTLMGVIVSKNNQVGLIRAGNGQVYFIRVNDSLGESNGVVSSINRNGIEVKEGEKLVSLVVRNRGAINEKSE